MEQILKEQIIAAINRSNRKGLFDSITLNWESFLDENLLIASDEDISWYGSTKNYANLVSTLTIMVDTKNKKLLYVALIFFDKINVTCSEGVICACSTFEEPTIKRKLDQIEKDINDLLGGFNKEVEDSIKS